MINLQMLSHLQKVCSGKLADTAVNLKISRIREYPKDCVNLQTDVKYNPVFDS